MSTSESDAAAVDGWVPVDVCQSIERARDQWKAAFEGAADMLSASFLCDDECRCSGRVEVEELLTSLVVSEEKPQETDQNDTTRNPKSTTPGNQTETKP